MYIAQRWLLGMGLAMWIGLCSVDIYLKDVAHSHVSEFNKQKSLTSFSLKNSSTFTIHQIQDHEKKIRPVSNTNRSAILQYIMFMIGACLVLTYYKTNILLYTMIKLKSINIDENIMKKHFRKIQNFKITANIFGVAILKFSNVSMGVLEQMRIHFLNSCKRILTSRRNPQNMNILLLNKVKEYSTERRNLGKLLIATIKENKNIRMQYQLESLAKKRLVKQIEDTQKQMKENRSRYVSYQQLYVTARQDNAFLKSRIKKLTHEKEEAERNLIKLVNYVWQSQNNDLKVFCSELIVKTKNNLLYSDTKAEIDRFLVKSTKLKHHEQESKKLHSLDTINEINENAHEEEIITVLVKNAPKLRGLPGECVWTVKDKDGFIEKLYEYDNDFDNGDTIRKIRQYSVYYDKDCLLDVSNSTTFIQNTNVDVSDLRIQYTNKCITGSKAFQKFLNKNKAIVRPRKPQQLPQLTY